MLNQGVNVIGVKFTSYQYTDHRWYNLSRLYFVKVIVSFKIVCRDVLLFENERAVGK